MMTLGGYRFYAWTLTEGAWTRMSAMILTFVLIIGSLLDAEPATSHPLARDKRHNGTNAAALAQTHTSCERVDHAEPCPCTHHVPLAYHSAHVRQE